MRAPAVRSDAARDVLSLFFVGSVAHSTGMVPVRRPSIKVTGISLRSQTPPTGTIPLEAASAAEP